jgi:hypothetical protein
MRDSSVSESSCHGEVCEVADLDKSDAVLWAVGPARHVSQRVEDVTDVAVAQAPATSRGETQR